MSTTTLNAAFGTSDGRAKIKSLSRQDETIKRYEFDGDNFYMSWGADDRLYVSVCDGLGYLDQATDLFNSRMFTLDGGPNDAKFTPVPGYPDKTFVEKTHDDGILPYHAFATLALDGKLYQFLSNIGTAVKLIYSPDNGLTWCNQDGSTPVQWEGKSEQSHETMAFVGEPGNTFPLLSILQMGRNYEHNRDGYVYVYSPNGMDERMNQLVMFRVPKDRISDRQAYEFFAGPTPEGDARWSKDINDRDIVHSFPSGWVNKKLHPYAWQPSITYNAPLNLYMMANWATLPDAEGMWFSGPSYLGFWTAPNPWGPWTLIHEDKAWVPGGDPKARAYQPQIVPKWIAEDGRSFWMVWTDFQHTKQFWPTLNDAFASKTHEEFIRLMKKSRKYRPYYSFNVQRVDLTLA